MLMLRFSRKDISRKDAKNSKTQSIHEFFFAPFFSLRLCVSILMFSLLTGCFGPAPALQITTYQLQEVSQQKLARTPTCTTLLVLMPTTIATYQTKNMLYSLNEYQTQPFAKNQWVAQPTQMLLPLIVISLRNTNYFHAVVPAPFTGKTDYQLATQLTSFQQYFSEESAESYFKMSLLAVLTNSKTRKVVAERRFDAIVSAPERSPYGGVIAANQATRKILTQLSIWVVQRLRYYPHRCQY